MNEDPLDNRTEEEILSGKPLSLGEILGEALRAHEDELLGAKPVAPGAEDALLRGADAASSIDTRLAKLKRKLVK